MTERLGRGQLLNILGVGFGIAVAVGGTVGAGILRTPGEIARQLPHPWAFVGIWLIGSAYALLGSNVVSELGTMLPRSGGQYVFSRVALGPYAGFIVGWSDFLSTAGTSAAVSIVIAEYGGVLLGLDTGRTTLVATFIVVAFAILQWKGMEWGKRTQEITAVAKTVAFAILIAACFLFRGTASVATSVVVEPMTLLAWVIAAQAVIYTYDGWAGLVYFSEEVRQPARDIPRAMFGGVLLVTAIYFLLNLGFLLVVPLQQLAGEPLAAGRVASVIFGPRGDTVIRVLMIISMLSAINAYHLQATRVLFAMSRDGALFRRGAEVNRGGTPSYALLLCTFVAVVFVWSGTFERVIALLAFFFVANYTLTFVSFFILRKTHPEWARPYRARGHPWSTGLVLVLSILFLAGAVAADTRASLWSIAILAASYPVFLVARRLMKEPRGGSKAR